MIEDTDKQAVIAYRIESAHKTLEEVNVNIQYQFWNSAINRMYYACYYAVSALLIANDISAQTHKGTKQMFCKEFISTGLLPREAGKRFHQPRGSLVIIDNFNTREDFLKSKRESVVIRLICVIRVPSFTRRF